MIFKEKAFLAKSMPYMLQLNCKNILEFIW